MSAYDWSQFHVHMYYLAPLKDVWERWTTAAGLESFYIYKAVHRAADGTLRGPNEAVQTGDAYEWQYTHDFAHPGAFTAVEPMHRLAFTFGDMQVSVSFKSVDGATEVALHQTGCATEDPDRAWQHVNCRSCWIYFMTNLRSVLAGGPDVRDHQHPQWNDSVSIGWDPATGPGDPLS